MYEKETTALEYTLNTAADSLNHQLELYENLITHVTNTDTVITTASREYESIYEKYEQFTYSYDVFLTSVYNQHPDVEQITLYTRQEGLSHGLQLRPLSELPQQTWFTGDPESIQAQPQWYTDNDGSMVVLAKVPEPYTKYIHSYSDNCVAIRIPEKAFFYFLDNISDDCYVKVSSPHQTYFEYTSPSIAGRGKEHMTSISTTIGNGWTITLAKPYYLIVQSAEQMILVMIVIIVVCLLLIFFLSNLFSEYSVKRINRLRNAMHTVQKGNFNIQIHDHCQDEIGELTNNFQKMADEIQVLIQENYQSKITLKEAQLKALQAQINPHFLYNCLSLINSRALLTHQEDISQMSQLMSTFYRTTLNKGRSDILL